MLDAFAVRRELINYKKVCLHMLLRIQGTERRLARLTTFYFRVHGALIQEGGGLFVHHERYTELANALQRCRGLLLAVRDGRDLAKSICCVPRAPCYSAASVPRLSGLPNTLAVAEAYSTFRLGNGTCWDHSQLGGTTPRGSGRYTTASMYQQQNAYSFGEDRS